MDAILFSSSTGCCKLGNSITHEEEEKEGKQLINLLESSDG